MIRSTSQLSIKNFGKLLMILEADIYKNIHPFELFFIIDGKTVYIYQDYLEVLFTFEDLN